ncbi:MAG: J domain-containing protein [Planctomycetota bacterium]
MSEDEPPWEALPHDPLAFFGLDELLPGEAEPDEKELRRRYTRLIKRYKPEREPERFQQIRAAYEELCAVARGGPGALAALARARAEGPREDAADDEDDEDDEELEAEDGFELLDDEPTGARPLSDELRALLARIEGEGARAAYELLLAKQPKEPRDYPRLALLADLMQEGRSFLDWVLEGLRAHPDDPGLEHLVVGLCRDGLPEAEVPAALERLARALTPGRFYAASLPLWLGLVRRRPFAEVEELLARCEREVGSRGLFDQASTPRLLFQLRLLRGACWRAPEAWVRQTLSFLSQHHGRLPSGLDHELDFVELLLEYLPQASRFCDGNPAAQIVDRCLRAYCELPEAELDREFLAAQQELRALGPALLAQFPPEDEVAGLALTALAWVARDVESRRFAEPPQVSRSQVGEELRRLELGYRGDPRRGFFQRLPLGLLSWVVVAPPFMALLLNLAAVVTLAVPSVRAVLFEHPPLAGTAVALWLLASFLTLRNGLHRASPRTVRMAFVRWCLRRQEGLDEALYLRRLRPAVTAFLLRTHLRAQTLADLIEAICDPPEGWSWDPAWLAALVRRDPGIGLLALANRFARV